MADYSVRPARPDDCAAVLAFCAQTWDFGDYIDRVWDRWLADPETDLLVAVDPDDRPVGLGQVRRVTPDEAWLEGLRVDPAVRQRGLARLLAQTALDQARQRGARAVRFATLATNTPMHRLSPQLGFERVGGFLFGQAEAVRGADSGFVPATGDLDRVAVFVQQCITIEAVGGLIAAGWSYARPSGALLERWLRETSGRLFRWPEQGRPLAYAWVEAGEPTAPLGVPWLAAERSQVVAAGSALRRLAAELGHPAVDWRVPDSQRIGAAAGAAGFDPRPEPGFWLYASTFGDPDLTRSPEGPVPEEP